MKRSKSGALVPACINRVSTLDCPHKIPQSDLLKVVERDEDSEQLVRKASPVFLSLATRKPEMGVHPKSEDFDDLLTFWF